MAGTLAHQNIFTCSIAPPRNRQSMWYATAITRNTVRMACSSQTPARMTLQTPPLRMNGFSGLKGSNAFDSLVKSGDTLFSKVASVTSIGRSRGNRIAPKALFQIFTAKAIKTILLSQEECRRLGHNQVGSEQILLGLIGEGTDIAANVLNSMGINLKDARVEVVKIIGRGKECVPVEIPFSARAKRVLEHASQESRQLGHNYIGCEHLLLGLLQEGEGVAGRVLECLGADPNHIRKQVIRMIGESAEVVGAGAGVGGGSSSSKMTTLEEFGTNLIKLAEEGKLDPVLGRQAQVELVTQILGRRTKNNPCSVGKTAIAGRLLRIANGDVPETIQGKKVITLDMGLLVAGQGEFEERLKKLMDEIKPCDDIIVFIDEVDTLIGALARGEVELSRLLQIASHIDYHLGSQDDEGVLTIITIKKS